MAATGISSLSRSIILSLRNITGTSNHLGLQAARKIKFFIHSRGTTGGIRHRKPQWPIKPLISSDRKLSLCSAINNENRASFLVPIQRISQNICKLNLNAGLWNARSLTGKIGHLSSTLINENLDLMFLTETWIKQHDDPIISEFRSAASGYDFYQRSRTQRRGGGVAILARSNLKLDHKKSYCFKTFECLEVTFRSQSVLLRTVVIYRPPASNKNKSTRNDFLVEFSSLLEIIIPLPGLLLIGGDFNFHLDCNESHDSAQLLDLLDSRNLMQHVEDATHVNGHTLDLLITRASDQLITDVRTSEDLVSDHNLVQFHVKFSRPPNAKVTRTFRKFSDIDHDKFNDRLQSKFSVFPPSPDPDRLCDYYNHSITEILDEIAPFITKTIVDKSRAAWYSINSDELYQLKRSVRQSERIWRTTRLTVHREIFITNRLKYCRRCDELKRDYHCNCIGKSDTKGLFSIVDALTGTKKANSVLKPTNIPPAQLCDAFALYFHDRVIRLRHGLTPKFDSPSTPDACLGKFKSVTTDEVIKLVNKSSTKSCFLDALPTNQLKDNITVLAPFFTSFFNSSLSAGIFPNQFKTAIIRPLLKKVGLDNNLLKNYRPISNLSFLSKTLERIVADQLCGYLSTNNLFAKFQSAYRPNHSTETAILKVHNDIMNALNNKKDVVLVMLDLSAAFDTLDHSVLIHRLQHRFGINGTVLQWFISYLTDRSFSISFDSSSSSTPSNLLFGVPQGSVLGPILFTLYTVPLEDIFTRFDMDYMLYADDSQLYVVCNKPSDSIKSIERCIEDIRAWLKSNMLVLNPGKTEVIQFSSRYKKNVETLNSLSMGGSDINLSSSVRNLGVYLESNGDSASHVNHICKSAYYALYRIGKIRSLLDQAATTKLVHAFVTSRLDYCNIILYGCPQSQLDKLQSVQNAAARLVNRMKKSDHITAALQDLHWLRIRERIDFKVLLTVYKIVNNFAPSYLCALVDRYIPGHRGLRSSNPDLFLLKRQDSKCTTRSYGWRAFSNYAPLLWNDLPLHIRQSISIDIFKRSLKTHLFCR